MPDRYMPASCAAGRTSRPSRVPPRVARRFCIQEARLVTSEVENQSVLSASPSCTSIDIVDAAATEVPTPSS